MRRPAPSGVILCLCICLSLSTTPPLRLLMRSLQGMMKIIEWGRPAGSKKGTAGDKLMGLVQELWKAAEALA